MFEVLYFSCVVLFVFPVFSSSPVQKHLDGCLLRRSRYTWYILSFHHLLVFFFFFREASKKTFKDVQVHPDILPLGCIGFPPSIKFTTSKKPVHF